MTSSKSRERLPPAEAEQEHEPIWNLERMRKHFEMLTPNQTCWLHTVNGNAKGYAFFPVTMDPHKHTSKQDQIKSSSLCGPFFVP